MLKEFAEPVALSSTEPTDLPLPRTTARLGFVLLALRARRKRDPKRHVRVGQGACEGIGRYLRTFSLCDRGTRGSPWRTQSGPPRRLERGPRPTSGWCGRQPAART